MSGRGGLSLLEVVISLALLAVGILFVLAIIPTSVNSLKRTEDIEAAAAYGMELIEDARRSMPTPDPQTWTQTFNQTEFKFTRELVIVNQDLTDIVVTAHWRKDMPDLKLVTRVHAQPAEPPASGP